MPPLPSLASGLVENWTCAVALHGPSGETVELTGMINVRTGYPVDAVGEVNDTWEQFAVGQMPYLPAGPWFGASGLIGEALCEYNTLREIELALTARL